MPSLAQRAALPTIATVLLLLARLFPAPPLTDPVAGSVPPGVHLEAPPAYLLFAPVFTLWDGVSMLSMSRLSGLLAGVAVLYFLWRLSSFLLSEGRGTPLGRELRLLVSSLAILAAFLLAGAIWHRPMLALAGAGPNELVVDFHSHTNASHDVKDTWMRGYDVEANRRWHRRAGFDAVFITDHNLAPPAAPWDNENPVICPGTEVSAWRSHIVLLGDTAAVDRRQYNASLVGLLRLLSVSDSSYGARSVASLPEYRRNHWGRLDTLVQAGLDGFEIVNASPKANELTRAERDSVISLARRSNRFLVGVSDSHGWGATSMVWNLVTIRQSPAMRRGLICHAILDRLAAGFPAVRIVERQRLRPDDWWPLWLTPIGTVWETWRGMGWPLTLAWAVWLWLAAALALIRRTRHQ